METQTSIEASLIAPCGMNCALCRAYQREKKKCAGCYIDTPEKSNSCILCSIRNCERISSSDAKFCYDCISFPCKRMKQLDKRYRLKYAMSMIENLDQIKNLGMEQFIENQRVRWTCPDCGGVICVHDGYCLKCHETQMTK